MYQNDNVFDLKFNTCFSDALNICYISFIARRGYSHLKEEDLDRTMWRHHFGGGFGPVVRQNTE